MDNCEVTVTDNSDSPNTSNCLSVSNDENGEEIEDSEFSNKRRRRRIIDLGDDDEEDQVWTDDQCGLKRNTDEIPEILNEKPKPKSKKQSTILMKERQARALLESAIIIPVVPSIRNPEVQESDEMEEEEPEEEPLIETVHSISQSVFNEQKEESPVEEDEDVFASIPDPPEIQRNSEESSSNEDQSQLEDKIKKSSNNHTKKSPSTSRSKRKSESSESEVYSPSPSSSSSSDYSETESDLSAEEVKRRKRKRRKMRKELKRKRRRELKERANMLAKEKKSRFYDKSRNIPNEIYFGDVQVPLHVLYSYETDSDTEKNHNNIKPGGRKGKYTANSNKSTASGTNSKQDPRVAMMKKYVKAAGIKGIKYGKLWMGCRTNVERVDRVMKILKEHGLQGEPTIAKCRELKMRRMTQKEIEDLDQNAIIEHEGRSLRNKNPLSLPSDNLPINAGEVPILTFIKSIIDSESD